jgi:peptidoglycan/LPS O-acetylase OafA/YrhL
VFVQHYSSFWGYAHIDQWAWTGVDLFFVLSGFLITGILFDTRDDPRRARNFYIRRALRIFPIFYGFFLLLFLLTPILHLHYERSLLTFVFYIGNLTIPFADLVHHNPTVISVVRHGYVREIGNIGPLWSLCVEEQFYLIWPWIVWSVRDRRRLMQVCIALSVAALCGRFYLWFHASEQAKDQYLMLWSTYTRCDTLLVGAWLALWLRGRALTKRKLRQLAYATFLSSMLVLVVGSICSPRHASFMNNPFIMTVGLTLIALAAAGLLLRSLDDESLLSRVLQWRPLGALGAISYGFYFFHALPYEMWQRLVLFHPHLRYAIPFFAFGITVLIASVSFRYYESPFLRLKHVLAPQRTASKDGHGATPHLHVSEPEPTGGN